MTSVGAVWKPRLIALDLDGTLVAPDDTIPAAIETAVKDAVAAGIHVVIATGRGWHATRRHVETLALPAGPHVCSNGAVVLSFPPLHIEEKVTFDPRSTLERVTAEHPRALIAVEEVGKGYLVNRLFPEGELGGHIEVASLERLASRPVTRVVVRDPEASDGEFIAMAHRLGLEGVSYSIGYTAWLDIAPEGVNKAVGLASVAERLGVDAADVLAMGDGRNDIEMLTWAGRGVALGDAPAEVQAVADHVTGLFDDGGTVDELRRWV